MYHKENSPSARAQVCKCKAHAQKSLLIIAIECMLLVELRQEVGVFKEKEPILGVCQVPVDPDELQLLDEFDSEWVAAWKKAVRKRTRASRSLTKRPLY